MRDAIDDATRDGARCTSRVRRVGRFAPASFRIVLTVALATAASAAHEPAAMPRRLDRPLNLLLITADDMNADSAGWMGSPLQVTPHLDALAASGHRFVDDHLTASICQPSREALLTG